ncbi:MAG TPA: class F sortase [Trebonia sp.]|jgi:hypothetical protein
MKVYRDLPAITARVTSWRPRRLSKRAAAGAAGASAVIVAAAAFGISQLTGGAPAGPAQPQAASPRPSVSSPATPATIDTSSPRLIISSIGADAPVVNVGASGPDGGALSVPSSVQVVGWWDGIWQSPNGTVREKVAQPGQPGVALLAGHIDSAAAGPGALYRLQQIKTGAAITVVAQGRKVTRWKVTRLQIVNKDALPAALFVNSGSPQLAVVSCGGPFDSSTGHYVDNAIAWAVPVTSGAST